LRIWIDTFAIFVPVSDLQGEWMAMVFKNMSAYGTGGVRKWLIGIFGVMKDNTSDADDNSEIQKDVFSSIA
jgi:hypothetical protein